MHFSPRVVCIGCGVGGEVLGAKRAGYIVTCCIDLCPANCAVLERRYPDTTVIRADINAFDQWRHHIPPLRDVVTVALQCQPSSSLNAHRTPDDPRHDTNYNMVLAAIYLNPSAILIENVAGFADNCPDECERVMLTLESVGYTASLHRINSKAWTASSRPRIYIIAMRGGGTNSVYDVEAFAKNARPKTLRSAITGLRALWSRPFRDSKWYNGSPCIIGPDQTYPCITTKVFDRMPRHYTPRKRDANVPYHEVTAPTVPIICALLGFPPDYFTDREVNADRCTCPVCNKHRACQIGRQLGRVWCPAAAREILIAIMPDLIRVRRESYAVAYNVTPPLSSTGITQLARHDFHVASHNTIGATSITCKQMLTQAHHDHSRTHLTESVCQQYVSKVERETNRDICSLAPPKYYDISQIKVYEGISPRHRQRIDAIHKKYKAAYLTNSNELPPPVLDDDLHTPLKVHYRFKDTAKPVKVPKPKLRPGSAAYKIMEMFRIDYEKKKLIRSNPLSRWAARPHLVAKFAEDAARTGIPDSIRFTGDFTTTNTQLDLIAPTYGDIPTELDRTSGWRWYIKLDAAASYWSFLLDDISSEASTIWLPCNGEWRLYSMNRLVMGSKNAATIMTNYYYHICKGTIPREHFSNMADDFVLFANEIDKLLDVYEKLLSVFVSRNVKIKPPKLYVCFPQVEYYGWTVDVNGLSPAERNIKPFRNMVAPKNISELRRIMGLFQCFSRFITIEKLDPKTNRIRPYFYKELVAPFCVKAMNDTSRGKTFKERWGPEQDAALKELRDLLIKGVHLFTPLGDRPFHMTTDMSDHGYGAYLYQLADDGTKRTVSHFNGTWSRGQRFMPPPYKEALAWALGFEKFLPLVRSHGQPFYTYTDSTPVGWMRKGNGRRAMSAFRLAQFDEVEWRVFYLQGARNVEADCLSRAPMLGELDPSIPGVIDMLKEALACLPHNGYKHIFITGDSDTECIATYIRGWRGTRGKTETGSHMRLSPQLRPAWSKAKPAQYDLAIALPPVEFGPTVCGDLLRANKPFICMVESQLICRIAQRMDFSYDANVSKLLTRQTSRRAFPAMGYTMIIGGLGHTPNIRYDHRQFNVTSRARSPAANQNAPSWTQYHCANPRTSMLCQVAYRSRCLAAPSHSITLPGLGGQPTQELGPIASWREDQIKEKDKLKPSDRNLIQTRDDGTLVRSNDGLVFVPSSKREALVKLTHERMFHLGAKKVYAHLRRYYWWPIMRQNIIDILQSCEECQLTKGKQYRAHKMWRSVPLSMPRSAWGFDFKGAVPSDPIHGTVYAEIGLAIDHASHRLVLFAQPDRQAATTAQAILDNIINVFGVPLQWRTDSAAELLGNVMTRFWEPYGTSVTDTKSYHAQGNALAERAMGYINICLRLLSDEQYRHWPHFLSSIQAAWNSTRTDTVEATPFEIDTGTPMRTPESIIASGPQSVPGVGKKPTPAEVLHAVQQSAATWAHVSQRVSQWHKDRTAERLNAVGHKRDFKVGDTVMIYMPPTAEEARRRKRKAKHLDFFRGPCTVTHKDGTVYKVEHNKTKRVYERTIQNVSPYRLPKKIGKSADEDKLVAELKKECSHAQKEAVQHKPTLEQSPADTSVYSVGELIAAKDSPTHNVWWLHEVIAVTDSRITTHIYGTVSPRLAQARFRPLWVDSTTNKVQFARPPKGSKSITPWTQVFLATSLPALVLARKLMVKHGETTSGKLTGASLHLLQNMPGSACHASVGKDMSAILTSCAATSAFRTAV